MNRPMTVRLEVAGHLSPDLAEWFEPLRAQLMPSGITMCSGTVPDQAAVHALCNRLRDLGISITSLSVTRKELEP